MYILNFVLFLFKSLKTVSPIEPVEPKIDIFCFILKKLILKYKLNQ